MTFLRSSSRPKVRLEHDLFRKPVATFRDHAPGSGRPPVHESGGFLTRRQAPVGRELVDHAGKNLRQLLEELLLGHPAALRQLLENVGTKRRPELTWRNL